MSEKNELQRLWVGVGEQTGFKLNELKEKLASIEGLLDKHTNINEFSTDFNSKADIDLIDSKIKLVSVHLSTLIEAYTNLAEITTCNLNSIDNKCNTLSEAIEDILHDIGG